MSYNIYNLRRKEVVTHAAEAAKNILSNGGKTMKNCKSFIKRILAIGLSAGIMASMAAGFAVSSSAEVIFNEGVSGSYVMPGTYFIRNTKTKQVLTYNGIGNYPRFMDYNGQNQNQKWQIFAGDNGKYTISSVGTPSGLLKYDLKVTNDIIVTDHFQIKFIENSDGSAFRILFNYLYEQNDSTSYLKQNSTSVGYASLVNGIDMAEWELVATTVPETLYLAKNGTYPTGSLEGGDWLSYNENVVKIIDGVITAVGPGTARINYYRENSSTDFLNFNCNVTVSAYENGTYSIKNAGTSKSIRVSDISGRPTCETNTNALAFGWRTTIDPTTGYFRLYNLAFKRYIGSTYTNVTTYNTPSDEHTLWKLNTLTNGKIHFQSPLSNDSLWDSETSTSPKCGTYQATNDNFKWTLEEFVEMPSTLYLAKDQAYTLPTNGTWTTSNANIARILNGKVIGNSEGTATITQTDNGATRTFTIIVKPIAVGDFQVYNIRSNKYLTMNSTGYCTTQDTADNTCVWTVTIDNNTGLYQIYNENGHRYLKSNFTIVSSTTDANDTGTLWRIITRSSGMQIQADHSNDTLWTNPPVLYCGTYQPTNNYYHWAFFAV